MGSRRRWFYVAASIVAIWLAIPITAAAAGFNLRELGFVLLFSTVLIGIAILGGWAEYQGLSKLEKPE